MKTGSHKQEKPFQKFYKDAGKQAKATSGKPKDFKGRGGTARGKGKPEDESPKRSGGRKTMSRHGFEQKDLSFGRKREKPKTAPKQEDIQPEVTFSKELKNKWEREAPPRPVFKSGKSRHTDKDEKPVHRHPKKKTGFEKHFAHEEQPEQVYAAKGARKHLDKTPDNAIFKASDLSATMPLNKYIAHCDVCGRREAALLVKAGKVKVNGELITEPGFKVTAEDKVVLSGKKLHLQENWIYILLNKPKGFITTTDDPKGRRTVMDIFQNQIEERIFPVGRLDRNTTGLLLLTNDGGLSQKLAHPTNEIRKVYQVVLDKPLNLADFQKIQAGLTLEDGAVRVDNIAYLSTKAEIGLEIHSGKNRIIRRIFESLGYAVEKLDRVMYAGLTKKNVPRGKWRFLSKQEVINLKHLNK